MVADDGDERESLDSVQDAAERRQHERTESVEDTLQAVREDLGSHKYPVRSEELAAYYADSLDELPNETEDLSAAFDRLDMSFEDPEDAYRALVSEFDEGRLEGHDAELGAENPTWDEAQPTDRSRAAEDVPADEDEPDRDR